MCVCLCVCVGGGGGEGRGGGGGARCCVCVVGRRCWKQNCFLGGGVGSGSAAEGGPTEKVGIPYL